MHEAPLETPYLELLARAAPAEAYEGPLLSAREAGRPPHETAALERGKFLALRVRGELEGRRRREAELTALIETVHDLAELRDLDDVLRAIVQRARSLLGTEVAYMTLTAPEEGDTYMRVTDGSVSARFQQLRLGMGEGLGGLVAQTARPYVTDDYPADARFRHTGPIDTAVGEEGLVAILGVPLLLGSREVIGVLYAADRRARVFEREQVALLGSFAAHAAVAIDTARLLSGTRDALAGLETANESIERAGDVHDRLTELVLRGGDVTDVAESLSEVLEGRVEFVEAAGTPLSGPDERAFRSSSRSPDRPPGAADSAAVERSRADGHAVRDGDAWVAAVSAGGEPLGALVLHGHPGVDPVDRRTFERAAMVTSLLLLARRSAGEAERRIRGELLDELLDATGHDPHLLRTRAARLHADLDAPHVVLTARLDADTSAAGSTVPTGAAHTRTPGSPSPGSPVVSAVRQRLWAAASHLAVTRRGLAAVRDGAAVLLLPLPEQAPGHVPERGATTNSATASRIAQDTAVQLGTAAGASVTVGASAPVAAPATDTGAVAAAYPEALRCADALRLLGRTGQGAASEDFGFLGMLLTDTRDVGGFVRRTLGPVLDYDERRGTGLVATLDAYFACGMSPVRAKEELHVHVNTVAQRLDRVARLLGDDWQSPVRLLETQLALRLHRLSGAISR